MANYILEDWGDKELWVLNNATWVIYLGYDCLKIEGEDVGGSGEREVATINNNWKFKISTVGPLEFTKTHDIEIYLDGDPNPIIFRLNRDDPWTDYYDAYIIYDGDIKAEAHTTISWFIFTIHRDNSVYFWDNYDISFDYGSKKKPTKIKLFATSFPNGSEWFLCRYDLLWWYTQTEDQAFIT